MIKQLLLYGVAVLYFILFLIIMQDYIPSDSEYRDVISSNGLPEEITDYHLMQYIKMKINLENTKQNIFNEEKFGRLEDDDVVILIQVHNRTQYLKHLVESLSYVYDISKALLIFSHDYFDETINTLVRNISFCKTMQIFYPYSMQINPNEFPGDDTQHCPTRRPFKSKQVKGCDGSYDSYENLRKAKYCQMKHHWFWNMNVIFDQLHVTRNHSGIVIYLEEDYYVMNDFLHVLNLMLEVSINRSVDLFSLISRKTLQNPTQYSKQYYIVPWHMDGIALRRFTWNKIKKCAFYFCTYDDYNWDWSLLYLSHRCLNLTAMVLRLPRIYHIGQCGMHGKFRKCQSWKAVRSVRKHFAHVRPYMFPPNLEITIHKPNEEVALPYGGWGDKRDKELCMNMTKMF